MVWVYTYYNNIVIVAVFSLFGFRWKFMNYLHATIIIYTRMRAVEFRRGTRSELLYRVHHNTAERSRFN